MCVGKCMPWHTCGGQALVMCSPQALVEPPKTLAQLMPHWKHLSGLGVQHGGCNTCQQGTKAKSRIPGKSPSILTLPFWLL